MKMRMDCGRSAVLPVADSTVIMVATGGGCNPAQGRPRAGSRVTTFVSAMLAAPCVAPVRPPSAGRFARWPTLRRGPRPASSSQLTDYVERKVSVLRDGAHVVGKHHNLWPVVRLSIHKVAGIRWVKDHFTEQESAGRGIPQHLWVFNSRVDEQAARGGPQPC